MNKLYEISDRYLQALSYFEGDLEEDAAKDTLESIEGEAEEKALSIAKFAGNLKAEAVAIDNAIKQMQARKNALYSKSEWLKNYLKINMEAMEISEIKCPYFVLKIKKNPPSVVIDDENLIPDEFKSEVITIKIDKAGIKKAGGCDGASLVSGTRLDIK